MTKAESEIAHPAIVLRNEWLVERKKLLGHEKELNEHYDRVNAERRRLPMVKLEKEYVFDAFTAKFTFAELFDGRSQLFIKHLMMRPGLMHQCVGFSIAVDYVEGLLELSKPRYNL